MALIIKSDFSQYVQFTENIKDRMLDFHIEKAENLDFKPLVPDAFWTAINSYSPGMGVELAAFVEDYVKPVVIHQAMNRFLIEAGVNITQFGIVNPTEETSQPASDAQRANMRNQYKADLAVYLSKFYARLNTVKYTFDGTEYEFNCKRKASGLSIHAI